MNLQDALKQELMKLPFDRAVKFNTDHAFIRCWNPKHSNGQERTPSLKINLDFGVTNNGAKITPGRFICFGCGMTGGWADVAEKFYLKKLKQHQIFRDTVGEIISERDRENLLGGNGPAESIPDDAIPWPENLAWRTISGKTVSAVGGLLYYDFQAKQPRCLFPVNVNGDTVGYIKANTVEQPKRNYFNSAGSWTKEKGLFPYDYVAENIVKFKRKILYLVEGPRDAGNLIQYGAMSLAIIGAGNSWSEEKATLVRELDPDLIVLMLDTDDAGVLAAKRIAKSLKYNFPMIHFKFPKKANGEKFDASDLSRKQVELIHQRHRNGVKRGKYHPVLGRNKVSTLDKIRRKVDSTKRPATSIQGQRAALLRK